MSRQYKSVAHEFRSPRDFAPHPAVSTPRGSPVKAALGVGAVLSYPLLVYASLSTGRPWLAILISAAIVGALIPRKPLRYTVAALLAAVAALSWLGAGGESLTHLLVFAPPVFINVAIAWLFGRTLLPGREPLIAAFARIEQEGLLPVDLARHARIVTMLWAAFAATMALVSLVLAAMQWLAAWSLFTGVINYVLVAMLMVGEHAYRRVRYSHYRHFGIAQMRRYARLLPDSTSAPAGRLALLPEHGLNDAAAWREGRFVSTAELIGHAQALATQLPAQRYVMNLCRDRYQFTVAFLATILAGKVNLLPPTFALRSLEKIVDEYGDVCCIADHRSTPETVPTIQIAACTQFEPAASMPRVPEDQIVALLFTSGSTGRPTPHAKQWGALVQGARALRAQINFAHGDIALGGVPPQHMYGLETTVLLPLQCGGVLHAGWPLLPPDIEAAVTNLPRPVWLMTTPLQLRACAEQETELPALCGIVSATMPLSTTLAGQIEARYGCTVREIYGCTEVGMIATRQTTADERWTLAPGLRLRTYGAIAVVDGGHAAPAHRLADRLEHIGARHFILHGRDSDLVKIAGKRISLEALNRSLREVPGVQDAVYFVPAQPGHTIARPIAFAIAPGLTPDVILRALRERLDPVFLPRPLYLVDELPRTPTGKISRIALEELCESARPVSALA